MDMSFVIFILVCVGILIVIGGISAAIAKQKEEEDRQRERAIQEERQQWKRFDEFLDEQNRQQQHQKPREYPIKNPTEHEMATDTYFDPVVPVLAAEFLIDSVIVVLFFG